MGFYPEVHRQIERSGCIAEVQVMGRESVRLVELYILFYSDDIRVQPEPIDRLPGNIEGNEPMILPVVIGMFVPLSGEYDQCVSALVI